MKLRLIYKKEEPAKFMSHRDIMRALERAIRRAELPIAYSQGFNPHMKISYSQPVKVGITAENLWAEITLEKEDQSISPEKLNWFLPEGIKITQIF